MPGIYNIYDDEGNPIAVDCTGDRARLIAAAPDLLSACKNLFAWLNQIWPEDVFTGESGDPGAVEVVKLRNQTMAAIAKATGVSSYCPT